MIGEVLEGYELTRKLGEGATGETYLGVHRESGQKAAVKLLFAQLSSEAALAARFLAEVRRASQVNHVGIVDLYACGVHASGRIFMVMELLEGKTLTDALIDLGSVSDTESFADIGWQLATLLEAAHGAGIVHAALKPDGIFMTFPPEQGGRALVRLLDFGTAGFSLNVRHSQTGSLLGAPLYMSPEASKGLGTLDRRADVYSLGCILFEMACGRPPFVREGKGELIIAHATEAPPSVVALEPSVPVAIDTLIGRMLTKNPAARPQSMAEVASVLERFVKRPGPSPSVPAALPAAPAMAEVAPPVAYPAASSPAIPAALPDSPAVPRPTPRRQDPTALLPPDPLPGTPVQQTWLARVHQTTAILEPPRPSALATPPLRPSHRMPLPSQKAKGGFGRLTASLSLPVVIATAAVVVAIGTAAILLAGRRPPQPRIRPPLLEQSRALDDEPTAASLAAPGRSLQWVGPDAGAYRVAGDDTDVPRVFGPASAARDKGDKRPPAKRW